MTVHQKKEENKDGRNTYASNKSTSPGPGNFRPPSAQVHLYLGGAGHLLWGVFVSGFLI